MKNLKKLPDSELVSQTRALVNEERRVGLEILHHLREISCRQLHWQLGYASLFTFATQELKYSEAAAWRRIKAMEALEEIPELESAIQEGRLSISTVSQVQGFCQAQKRENAIVLGVEEKKELFLAVELKSKRETEKILAIRMPQALPEERERILDGGRTEVRFVVEEALMGKLERLKDILANRLGKRDPGYAELLEYLADFTLKRIAPEREVKGERPVGEVKTAKVLPPVEAVACQSPTVGVREIIPARVNRLVWRRDGCRCTYVDSSSGYRCVETRGLEIDHIVPVCRGGTNEPGNLRLRCRAHNVYEAIQVLGKRKMQLHLPSLR